MTTQNRRPTIGEAIADEVRKDQGETPTFPFSEREVEGREGLMEAIGGTPQSDPSETENEADIALAGARVAHEKQSNDNAEAQKPDPKEAERNTEAAGISAAAIAVMVQGIPH
jgi:hypothetical protein